MASKIQSLSYVISDPAEEIKAARNGISVRQAESFLEEKGFSVAETLKRLAIPASTFFKKKQERDNLNTVITEKFIRLVRIVRLAEQVLGNGDEMRNWLDRDIPSLGNQKPMDLLDTEPGYRLVEQALLQIKHGIYG